MAVDFTKPIETVPCERNPIAVPCRVMGAIEDEDFPGIVICGTWFDQAGNNRLYQKTRVSRRTGKIPGFQGRIRNVAARSHPTVIDISGEMTLRDRFALKAMEVMLFRQRTMSAATIAEGAYTVADAMLKARTK